MSVWIAYLVCYLRIIHSFAQRAPYSKGLDSWAYAGMAVLSIVYLNEYLNILIMFSAYHLAYTAVYDAYKLLIIDIYGNFI